MIEPEPRPEEKRRAARLAYLWQTIEDYVNKLPNPTYLISLLVVLRKTTEDK